MRTPAAGTVEGYLASLPPERRETLATVRATILANLPPGYREGVHWGMIGYVVPLDRYPDTYNGQPLAIAGLAAQKQHYALYLMGVYGDPALERWFRDAYARTGKRLDMGKACVRFRSLDELPLALVGETIAKLGVDDFLARHEAVRAATRRGATTKKKPAAAKKKPAATKKKPAATKKKPAATKKKPATKKPATRRR